MNEVKKPKGWEYRERIKEIYKEKKSYTQTADKISYETGVGISYTTVKKILLMMKTKKAKPKSKAFHVSHKEKTGFEYRVHTK